MPIVQAALAKPAMVEQKPVRETIEVQFNPPYSEDDLKMLQVAEEFTILMNRFS